MEHFFPKVWASRSEFPAQETPAPQESSTSANKGNVQDTTQQVISDDERSEHSEFQAGVKNIEATTQVWTKKHLIIAYVMIWIIAFVDTMQQNTANSLLPYVTSSFQEHSLTATTSIVSSLVSGLIQLPLAKLLDIWGRPPGLAIMLFLTTVGLIMMAACTNVQMYAAAQVFYWVGYNGMRYTISIFVADTSSIRNRGLMFAFNGSTYMITTWLGGPIATAFLNGPGWRWGYGTFAVIIPAVTMPLYFLFQLNYKKAQRQGLIAPRNSGRTPWQSIKFYFVEFDVIGLLIIVTGLAMFLLPFSLYSYQPQQWRTPWIIALIVVGFLFICFFVVWERYLAPKSFAPWELLTDRTVLGACILAAVLFVSFYIWDSYFGSFLQVVNNLSITEASYVGNIYSIGSTFWAVIVGIAIRVSGRFKWLALYFGVPLTILGVALLAHFRQPDSNIGYIVMCQIFIAFAGGTLVICEQIAAMAATSHQYIAVVLALEAMFAQVGGAIGSTVAAAVWTGTFRERLVQYLPAEEQVNIPAIYGDLTKQLSYARGTAARAAIERAYGDAQYYMITGGSTVLVLAVVSVVMWRDISVLHMKQVKGNVV